MKNTPLRQRLIDEITLLGYSENTKIAYVRGVRRIAARYGRPPDEVGTGELRQLLLELCRSLLAASTLNLIVSSWIFFYDKVLGRDVKELKASLPRAKKDKVQIRAYSKEEVRAILYDSDLNLKHRTLLSTVYHAGLRVSEALNVQIGDIQSSNAAILVRKGKGKKDRYTLLPERLLDELRGYYGEYRPQRPWIFTSLRFPHQPVVPTTALMVFYKALRRCGLPNRGGIHCLRHSFATHHLQDGIDIARLQKLLGHASLATTARYLHVLADAPKLSRSPLDEDRDEDASAARQ